MISNVSNSTTASGFRLPEKLHTENPTSTFFDALIQNNPGQFATLDTAQAIASVLGGTVVDLKDQWVGGATSSQYAIQMPGEGPLLNAGIIAQRCASCGVEAGLSSALVEVAGLTGHPMSLSDAWSQIASREAEIMKAVPETAPITPPVTAEAPGKGAEVAADAATAGVSTTKAVAALTDTPAASDLKNPVDEKTANAARQFEALLIGQMLKSARESETGGWIGAGSDSTGVSAVELGEEQFAQTIAAQGGLGLTKLLLQGLSRQAAAISKNGSADQPASPHPAS